MSNAIFCDAGNGKGKCYQVSPDGHLILVSGEATKPGWRLATDGDIASAAAISKKLDAESKAKESAAEVAARKANDKPETKQGGPIG